MTVNYIPEFAVSSPGKVILFGEHAAVYNKPAIAAAVSLRTYLLVLPNEEKHEKNIRLEFPDINLVFECPVHDLPWHVIDEIRAAAEINPQSLDKNPLNSQTVTPPTSANGDNKKSGTDSSLDSPDLEINSKLVSALQPIISRVTDTFQHAAILAFFYLYMNICTRETSGYTFATRSTLPVGAGLGSSATFAVCLSAAFLNISRKLSSPRFSENEIELAAEGLLDSPAITPVDCGTSTATSTTNLGNDDHNIINKWAYIGEKCLHGNPSGIDNTVACRGGAVRFQRPSTLIPMKRFPELRLILTNTKQPRRTKDMVGRVGEHFEKFPEITKHLLDGIEQITKEAYVLLGSQEQGEKNKTQSIAESQESLKRFLQLVRLNHGLLYSLGVSHPKLEKIKAIGDELEIGETKLTGAGGGGCAITLLYNDKDIEKRIHTFKQKLESQEHGFEIFETVLGGPGVGLVSNLSVSSKQFLNMNRNTLESLSWNYWA